MKTLGEISREGPGRPETVLLDRIRAIWRGELDGKLILPITNNLNCHGRWLDKEGRRTREPDTQTKIDRAWLAAALRLYPDAPYHLDDTRIDPDFSVLEALDLDEYPPRFLRVYIEPLTLSDTKQTNRKQGGGRGRRRGTGLEDDSQLIEKMRVMVAGGKKPWRAAQELAKQAPGGGTEASKQKRLFGKYNSSD